MKLTSSLFVVVLAGLLASVGSGCSKKEQAPPPAARDGVAIDTLKLQNAFPPTSSPEVIASVRAVRSGVRYGNYIDALMALDKLAADPSLTEPQKKLVADVSEQVKQANNNKNGAAPADPAAK